MNIVWIKNSEGKYLISKRTPNVGWPNLWQSTAGSVVAGEDSLTSALREVKEELGIELDINKGYLYKTFMMQHTRFDEGGAFYDVWIFNQDIDLKDIKLQEETADENMHQKKKYYAL